METALANSLGDGERDALNKRLEEDGFVVLEQKLPTELMQDVLEAIDRITNEHRIRQDNAGTASVKVQNCVDKDPAFRKLMMYEPALQLAHDAFGPMFHLNQSNFVSRVKEKSEEASRALAASIDWHADGPRPKLFPRVNGAMGMHYLKFGYFLTDLTHATGGSLQVIRGSHKRDERDGKSGADFNIDDYADDFIQFDVEAGTVVAFHQALWHAAPPNQSEIERKNVYISYCPTWMRPVDRDFPDEADLEGLTSEERWLLGEPRPALRWWLPKGDDASRLARFARGTV